jgi:hypothetical protein
MSFFNSPHRPNFGLSIVPDIQAPEQSFIHQDIYFNVRGFDGFTALSIELMLPDGRVFSFSVQTTDDGSLGGAHVISGTYFEVAGQYQLKATGLFNGEMVKRSRSFFVYA